MADPVEISYAGDQHKQPALIRGAEGNASTEPGDRKLHVIEQDLDCRVCGYNLRGLSPQGHCPECEMPVAHALHGDWLRYSDPRWVATIARGYWMLSAAVAVGLLAIIFAAASRESLNLPWLFLAIALSVGVIALIGVWLATVREPAAAEHERWFSDRRLLRGLTIIGIALQAGSGFLAMRFPQGGLSIRMLAAAVMIFGVLLAFRHSIGLAQRIPDYGLVAETRAVMWGMIASYGLFLLIVALALGSGASSSFVLVAFGLSCTVIVGCVIFTLWCLTLFSRYASAMRLASLDARAMYDRIGRSSPA